MMDDDDDGWQQPWTKEREASEKERARFRTSRETEEEYKNPTEEQLPAIRSSFKTISSHLHTNMQQTFDNAAPSATGSLTEIQKQDSERQQANASGQQNVPGEAGRAQVASKDPKGELSHS